MYINFNKIRRKNNNKKFQINSKKLVFSCFKARKHNQREK